MLMLLLLPLSVPWVSWCGVVAADVVAQNTHYVQRLVIVIQCILYGVGPWYGRILVVNRCLFSWWPSLANGRGKFVMCADVTS